MADRTWLGTTDGDHDKAANWLEVQVPITGDTYIFGAGAVHDLDTNMDQSTIVPAAIYILHTLPAGISIGTASAYFKIGAPTSELIIGRHTGTGSPTGSRRIKLDLYKGSGTTPGPVIIERTATTSADANKQPVRLLADSADIDVYIRKGKVGLAVDSGETAVFGDVNISYVDDAQNDAEVRIGEGVTFSNLYKTGGNGEMWCGATAVENHDGTLIINGSGAVASLLTEGGTVVPNSTGTLTAAYCRGGLTDWTRNRQPRSVGTIYYAPDGAFAFDPAVLTVGALTAEQAVQISASEP